MASSKSIVLNNIKQYRKYKRESFTEESLALLETMYGTKLEPWEHCIYHEDSGHLIVYVWDTREVTKLTYLAWLVWHSIKPKPSRLGRKDASKITIDSNLGLKDPSKLLSGFYKGYIELDACHSPIYLKYAEKPTGLMRVGYKPYATICMHKKSIGFIIEGSNLYLHVKEDGKILNKPLWYSGSIKGAYDFLMLHWEELNQSLVIEPVTL